METENSLDIQNNADTLVELLLKRAGNFERFTVIMLLRNEIDEIDETYGHSYGNKLIHIITAILDHYGYVKKNNNDDSLYLTSAGIEAKKIGSHASYVSLLQAKEIAEYDRKKAEYNNLIHSTKVNIYLYKTRWVPHLLAVAALGVSIWALVESKKTKAEEPKIENKTIKPGNALNNTNNKVVKHK